MKARGSHLKNIIGDGLVYINICSIPALDLLISIAIFVEYAANTNMLLTILDHLGEGPGVDVEERNHLLDTGIIDHIATIASVRCVP